MTVATLAPVGPWHPFAPWRLHCGGVAWQTLQAVLGSPSQGRLHLLCSLPGLQAGLSLALQQVHAAMQSCVTAGDRQLVLRWRWASGVQRDGQPCSVIVVLSCHLPQWLEGVSSTGLCGLHRRCMQLLGLVKACRALSSHLDHWSPAAAEPLLLALLRLYQLQQQHLAAVQMLVWG